MRNRNKHTRLFPAFCSPLQTYAITQQRRHVCKSTRNNVYSDVIYKPTNNSKELFTVYKYALFVECICQGWKADHRKQTLFQEIRRKCVEKSN